ENITTPFVPEGYKHVYHQYTIRVQNRNEVQKKLTDMGVGTGIYYSMGLHQLGLLEKYCSGPMPVTEKAAGEVLSLPVHPGLADEELDKVSEAVLKAVG
ncbi:MAG: DegT/DnrJ/EryC1/StrS aminotransferase family protein, partial [Thermoplasmata archaeon]|nr:DegT/DnrJ/EryC1/StrS aminotransferase family protein [Thermoplasmata archaeon]